MNFVLYFKQISKDEWWNASTSLIEAIRKAVDGLFQENTLTKEERDSYFVSGYYLYDQTIAFEINCCLFVFKPNRSNMVLDLMAFSLLLLLYY